MDLMNLAQQLISQKLGDNVDSNTVSNGIQALFGGSEGGFDISNLVSSMSQDGGLAEVVGSWLGDGDNMPIDSDTVTKMFNSDQIGAFASQLGLDSSDASSLLADVVPNIVDQSSSGGNLLDSIGGIDGAMDFAKKFF
jgi:uncharacterized protein YidB (DUF937 family)